MTKYNDNQTTITECESNRTQDNKQDKQIIFIIYNHNFAQKS